MRFGPIPTVEAAGTYLAHTVRLAKGAFKKGRLLSEDDVARLAAEDIRSIVVARLDADDAHEDAAAARLAALLGHDLPGPGSPGVGLKASAAFTGRVNLLAETPGVLTVDAGRIDRINAIDESVTVATAAPYAAMVERQMAATIKIIPFAAPEAAVAEAEAIAREAGPPIALHPYRPIRAALIQTTLPSVKPSVLDKTVAVTAGRLEALGGALAGERRAAHDAQAVAAAIFDMDGHDADILLIAGASAIGDRADALPAGIEAAGGGVLHFGMPVDPGNLIMLAERGGKPVIGLPGCARSPKANGFDWVLQRFAAGLPVGRAEIQAMGVGGLLAEIPARPLPRAEATRKRPAAPRAPKVAAIVLAAGQSRRMGAENKLLADVAGKPMVVHAVEAARAADTSSVIVVTGHEAADVRAALAGHEVGFVHNPDYAQGLSGSLRTAAAAAPTDADAVIVLLGDMPGVTAAHIDRLIAAFNPVEGRAICVPTRDGKRGNPVLWARRFLPEMAELRGDVGAKPLIGQNEDLVVEVEMTDRGVLEDIDTPEALARLRKRG